MSLCSVATWSSETTKKQMVPPFHTSSKRSDNEVPKRKPIVLEFVTEFAPPSSFLFIPTQRADKLHLSVVIFDIKEKKNIYISMSLLWQIEQVNRAWGIVASFYVASLSLWRFSPSSFFFFSFPLGGRVNRTKWGPASNPLGWKKLDGFHGFNLFRRQVVADELLLESPLFPFQLPNFPRGWCIIAWWNTGHLVQEILLSWPF